MPTLNGMPAKVLGKIEAERPCDLCGTTLLKTAVVIECDGQQLHFGRDCAAMSLHGNKSHANQKRVDRAVMAAEHEARQQAEIEAAKLRRISTVEDCEQNSPNNPNAKYNRTGRPRIGSYFAEDSNGRKVRVDGTDPADVEFYNSRGFIQTTSVVEA